MKRLSVVVCTVNSYTFLEQCIKSILANDYSDFELIIVDQSNGHTAQEVVNKFKKTVPIIKYVSCEQKGLAHAKNHGAAHAWADLIAFTDEDCIVQKDWIRNIVEYFEKNKDAIVLYGSVIPAPYDLEKGRTSGGRRKDCILKGKAGMMHHDGTGGDMGIRKEFFRMMHGFDEVLTNTYFGAEDWDFAYRVLSADYPIHLSSQIEVIHNGFKEWSEAKKTLRRYEKGTAALFVKYLRCGDIMSLLIWCKTFIFKLRLIILTGFKFKRKSLFPKLIFIINFLLLYVLWNFIGFMLCFTYNVDRKNRMFINHRDKHT